MVYEGVDFKGGLIIPNKVSSTKYSKGEQFVCDGFTCFTCNECKDVKGLAIAHGWPNNL